MDYREKLYAVGRIPSTYNKREGTAKEHELLAVRAPPRCAGEEMWSWLALPAVCGHHLC